MYTYIPSFLDLPSTPLSHPSFNYIQLIYSTDILKSICLMCTYYLFSLVYCPTVIPKPENTTSFYFIGQSGDLCTLLNLPSPPHKGPLIFTSTITFLIQTYSHLLSKPSFSPSFLNMHPASC